MKELILLFLIVISLPTFGQDKRPINDTIPLTINKHNTIYVKAVFNEIDTLNLNFDSGTTELVLINDVLNNKLKSVPKLYNSFYNLRIGNHDYQTKVYDAVLSGHDTDGRFGWDLFKDKVVELNYDKNLMIVRSEVPENILNDNTYTRLNIKNFKNLLFIQSTISQNGVENTDLFLFDTGYQRAAMLDNDLLRKGNFPVEKMENIKEIVVRGAQGNEIPVVTSNLEKLRIGSYELENVPIHHATSHKPLKGENIHILGNEVLKRFNVFFDFQNNQVYLKPNKLYHCEYIEGKKGV